MKLIWLTDIHLNFLDEEIRLRFYKEIREKNGDAILITGDIAEAPSITDFLKEMESEINKPIYFVLGNHDYYRGQIDAVKKSIENLTEDSSLLHWLPASGAQCLTNEVVLIGQDAWADGRYGDYINSTVVLNDSRMIIDLFQAKILGKMALLEKMQSLADRDAKQLEVDLKKSIEAYKPKKIIVLTHVPPFENVCLHEGEKTDSGYLPFFASKAIGDVLLKFAEKHSTVEFLVLCGHTHSQACYQVSGNLMVKVGKAEYYQPEIQEELLL